MSLTIPKRIFETAFALRYCTIPIVPGLPSQSVVTIPNPKRFSSRTRRLTAITKKAATASLTFNTLAHSTQALQEASPYSRTSMAKSTLIALSTADAGVFSSGVRADSAQAASEVLQENMENYHIFFNDQGFHNHIVHHILTIYALGASPETIKAAFERDKQYQRKPYPVDESVVQAMSDKTKFKQFTGKEMHYSSFLVYFQRELDAKGVGPVLNEHLFAEDGHADDLLVRMFAGFLHPLIHLGFGVEFNQPAIVAEALAQAAVHDNWIGDYLLPAEKAAGSIGEPEEKTLEQLLGEIRGNEKLVNSVQWSDSNKIRDGILKRAPDEMLRYASQYTVSADHLEEKLAEMINAVVYYASTAQRPPKQIKFDFYYMHCVNCSIFFPALFSIPSLSLGSKIRLLEWKGRMDLAMYVSRRAPKLLLDEVTNYKSHKGWKEVFDNSVLNERDDGHVSKMTRAVAHGGNVCKPFEGGGKEKGFMIAGDMWLKIGNMIVDSVDSPGDMWVRSTGFDEAWSKFNDRSPQ
ncbi:hypothetical protein V1517DRAFT_326703 [Lipomyces orientalis]|uniref:Uncharacterized protein n=1 Tax=Lipomyces orientalis TaxID=1233043 RepID=A0ACC3TJM1_9ASCO